MGKTELEIETKTYSIFGISVQHLTFMDMAIQLNWILTLIQYSTQIPDFGIIQICKWNFFNLKS